MPSSHLWWMSLVLLGSFPCVAATSNTLNRLKSVLEGIISEPRKLAIVVVCASVVVIAILIWLIHGIAGCVRKRKLRKMGGHPGVPPPPLSNDASLSELEAATKVPSPTPSSNPTSCTSLKSPLDDDVTTFNVGLPTRVSSHKLSKRTSRSSQTPDCKPYRRCSQGQDSSRRDVPCLPSLNISLDGGRLPASERRGSLTADEQNQQNPSSDAALIACQDGLRRARPSVHWVSQGCPEGRGRHHTNSTRRGQQWGTPLRDVEAVVLSHTITYPSKCVHSPSEQIPQNCVKEVSVMQGQDAVSRNPTDRNRRVNLPNRYCRASHPTLPVDDRLPLHAAKPEG